MRFPRRWWRSRSARRDAGVVSGTFVMEAEWNRSEELRPDRLGPDEYDVRDPDRPVRTLGPLPKS